MPAGGGGGAPDLTHQQVEPQGYATGRPRRRQQPPVAGRHGPAYQVVAGHRVAVVVALQLCGLVAAGVAAVGLEAEAVVTVAEEEGGGPAVLVGRTLGENAGYSHGLAEVHLQPLVAVRGSGQSRFKVLHPVLQTGHPYSRFYMLAYRLGIHIQGFTPCPTDRTSRFKVLYSGLHSGQFRIKVLYSGLHSGRCQLYSLNVRLWCSLHPVCLSACPPVFCLPVCLPACPDGVNFTPLLLPVEACTSTFKYTEAK